MDDRTFDEKTATDWINTVEQATASPRANDIFPELNSWVIRNSLKEILEIGSGQGICSDKIDLENRRYTGLEPSVFMTDRAIELYQAKNRNFVVGNVYAIPFKDNSFDGCFSVAVWHLLSDLDRATQELARVLKTGGHFLIVTANPAAYPIWQNYYPDAVISGKRLQGTMTLADGSPSADVLYLHSERELLASLAAVSLKVDRMKTLRPSKEGPDIFVLFEGAKS